MRQHSEALLEVLRGSFTRRLLVNIVHGSDRVLQEQAFASWSLRADLGADVHQSGSGTVVYSSVEGETIAPVGTRGVLSPFRARIELVMEISAGDFSERVLVGTYRVDKIPRSREYTATVNGQERVASVEVETRFLSLEEDVRRRGFRFPETTIAGASCFDEIRRLTGMAVEETIEDRPAPEALVWEAKQGGRLEAVQDLADALGGVPVVNSVGAWQVIPDEVGEPVAELWLGEQGTVLDVGNEIDTETVYNVVVGTFEDDTDQRNPIYAVAEVTTGDLAVDGLYGEHVRYYSSEYVHNQSDADTAVRSILALSVGSQQYEVPIQCHLNPLIELGDVVELKSKAIGGEATTLLRGRVVSLSMSDSPYMNVTLRVYRNL